MTIFLPRHSWHAIFLMAALFVLSAGFVSADLLVYDGFDYPPGNIVGRNGGTGWNDAWQSSAGAQGGVAAESLKSTPPVATVGGHLETPIADSPIMRVLGQALFKDPGIVWISVLVRNDSLATTGAYSHLEIRSKNWDDPNTGVWIAKQFNGQNWTFQYGSQVQDLGLPADSTTLLIVLRVEHTANAEKDSIQAFVNPAPGNEPPQPNGTMTGLTVAPADMVVIRAGATTPKIFSYDEIRIGTTYSDVTPPSPDKL